MHASACSLFAKQSSNPRLCWPDCPGWGWFNSTEVQRCDDCSLFETDDDAAAHVADCASCAELLARWQGDEASETGS